MASSNINIESIRELLQDFRFNDLFTEQLGWSQPRSQKAVPRRVKEINYDRLEIAQMGGLPVFEISVDGGEIPNSVDRRLIHTDIAANFHENLLIFVDKQRTRSLWSWIKREDGKAVPRDHHFFKGQPGDLFLSKLAGMVVDIGELDEDGNLPVLEVARRLRHSLDVSPVTRKFYREFKEVHTAFLSLIEGIPDDADLDRRWYASVLLNRLMFIYFLQRKGFLNGKGKPGDYDYLQNKLAQVRKENPGDDYAYYNTFLKALFFVGFAKPDSAPEKNNKAMHALIGHIRYLNGGLFLPHRLEEKYGEALRVPNRAFENVFRLFESYSWNLNDTPGAADNELKPHVLGYIFEKYINEQKSAGAYYTRPEITDYLCEQTIYDLILEKVQRKDYSVLVPDMKPREFNSMAELLLHLDADLCRELLFRILPELKILDPAVGSGAFLSAAMNTLINVYSAVVGRIPFTHDADLRQWLKDTEAAHPSIGYYIKKQVISQNLFGVDLMEEATEIARLRLFLVLVASAQKEEELEPLPNIDFNILPGNSLVGLMSVGEEEFNAGRRARQFDLFSATSIKSYHQLLVEKREGLRRYRGAILEGTDSLTTLREKVDANRREAHPVLNEMLLADFNGLKIKYEQAVWDVEEGKEGKPEKRALTVNDIEELRPFHWGYEFDDVLNRDNGGFDIIITNPPWEIFKPNDKEFLADFSDTITKKKMTIKEFEKEKSELLKDPILRHLYEIYLSRFPHANAYFRKVNQYHRQVSIVNGKTAGTDINLFKLFLEQCFNLLCEGGRCGIVIPSGIYTDLGAKRLREMLFHETQMLGLFGFENRKEIFEGVHRSFKFAVLTYRKGGATNDFPAAFMRLEVSDLDAFPDSTSLVINVDLIKRLSPDSYSIMEFKSRLGMGIATKMLQFPLLGQKHERSWEVDIFREFHMTDDHRLFHNEGFQDSFELLEGKTIWQFLHDFSPPRHWVDAREGRTRLLRKDKDNGQIMPYQEYRLVFRDVTANTNERTMIATVIPPGRFTGNTLSCTQLPSAPIKLYMAGVFNSYIFDWMIRQKVTNHCNFFYVYQMPVPRLTPSDPQFQPIVERAARLICTTPEFNELAKAAGLRDHRDGATDTTERGRLRAELDGLVAHLYGLTEDEFAYILTTFPLVPEPVKLAARNAYRDIARGVLKI